MSRLPHGGTFLGEAVTEVRNERPSDVLIVVTDEQSHSRVTFSKGRRAPIYLINVGSYMNGIGYFPGVVHIDGFSDSVVNYILASERERLTTRRS